LDVGTDLSHLADSGDQALPPVELDRCRPGGADRQITRKGDFVDSPGRHRVVEVVHRGGAFPLHECDADDQSWSAVDKGMDVASGVLARVRGWFSPAPCERPMSPFVLIYFVPVVALVTVAGHPAC
jgi:hypothetical protein